MNKFGVLPHFHTGAEVAALVQTDPDVIERLVRCRIHPPYIWKNRWRAPRWNSSRIPEWRRILDQTDIDSLPKDPPPLQRPAEVFRKSLRMGPSRGESAIAARMLGLQKKESPVGSRARLGTNG